MIEELKRTLYAGIGAGVVTYEKLETVLQDLVEKGKLSASDARATAEKISSESKQEFERRQSEMQQWMDSLLEKAAVAKKKDLAALQQRVEQLETIVAEWSAK